jgi:hypothetical protein
MRRILLVVFAVAAPLVVAFVGLSAVTPSDQRLPGLPTEWVPFSADLRLFGDGIPESHGRFHRYSDGSTRSDTRVGRDVATTINNVTLGRAYSYTGASGWVAYPLETPQGGLHPTVVLATPDLQRLSQAWEGLVVFAHRDASGAERWVAPALNGFAVRRLARTGLNYELTNIVLGEPGEPLDPPDGSVVKEEATVRRMGAFPLGH